jgi:PAS domain-containing protein
MKNKNINFIANLRRKAEGQLVLKQSGSDFMLSECDNLKLINELQVYQLELEMQNDELRKSKEQKNQIAKKYSELYDFAPLGYFTLNKEGKIIEINHYASQMFNNEQKVLVNAQLGFYVIDKDKPVFNLFLEKVFKSNLTETSIVSMSLDNNIIKQVLLSGMLSSDGKHCLIASIDISERLQMEKESTELHQFNNFFIDREIKMVELKKEINELLQKGGLESKYPVR